jgi:hypothetical protein
MKKIFSSFVLAVLVFSGININNVGAIENTQDQSCSANLPYTLESSDSVFENGSLGQTFVPTQNRLNTIVLNLLINAADDESVLTVSITDFNEETVLASKDINITASLDGDQMLYIDFYDNDWQQYDVPLTPGDTYKIKLTSTTGGGNVRWPFKADPNCVAGGVSIVGGVMNLDKDFGFTTMGYTYVAPVVPPVVVPEEAPVVVPSVAAADPNVPGNTTTATNPSATTTNSTSETPALVSTADADGVISNDGLESSDTSLTKDSKTVASNSWIIIISAIGALIIGLLVFMQIKFHLFNKFLKKKRK